MKTGGGMQRKSSWNSLVRPCCFVLRESSPSKKASAGDLPADELSVPPTSPDIHVFTWDELRLITRNFSSSNFLGEGGFGPVHKGFIDEKLRDGLKAQPVAVKLLDSEGPQGHREWLAEVTFLGQLRHPNLVTLIGYCCEDEHRLIVYEYMARGSLEQNLFERNSATLPWSTRLKIAIGAAKGLAFLHDAEKSIIYRDFKASNILLDSMNNAKLSDFGLAKNGPEGDESHVSTRIMGTEGYAAPEYIMTGHLTSMSDVYSYGVVLLELLTGRRSVDRSRNPSREKNLVEWATSSLKKPQKLSKIMDPRLQGQYSIKAAMETSSLASQCLSHNPKLRPRMSIVVETLEPLQGLFDDLPTTVTTTSKEEVNPFTTKPSAHDLENGEQQLYPHDHRCRGHRGYRRNSLATVTAVSSFSDTALYRKYNGRRKKKQSKLAN